MMQSMNVKKQSVAKGRALIPCIMLGSFALHRGNRVRQTCRVHGCSLVVGLGLSHLLKPQRLSRAPSFVGWLLSYVKLRVIEKVNGQRMSTHSLYSVRLIPPYRATG